jgi:hypothetical protein
LAPQICREAATPDSLFKSADNRVHDTGLALRRAPRHRELADQVTSRVYRLYSWRWPFIV